MEDLVKISVLFTVKYGVNLELVNLDECNADEPDAVYFVSRTEKNNGISAIVRLIPEVEPNPAHTLSVAGGGSVLSTFYQPKPYYSGRDLYVLIPKTEMDVTHMLFYAYCIQLNKYKYNYGRQANRTLKDILIPSTIPQDFRGIEQVVLKSLQDISLDSLPVMNISHTEKISQMKPHKRIGLPDEELAEKYESGKAPMKKLMKAMLDTPPSNNEPKKIKKSQQ
jgi:hypothetical protein